jgi:FtsP/CotA-like multicopper oxidase with cupredoxin domain
MDFTGPQVYKGLAGLYVIRDETEDGLAMPKGEKEVPLVISDRTFKEDGSFYYPSIDPSLEGEPGVLVSQHNGMRGDTLLVNGAPWPFMEVTNTRHRFRILNASNARDYGLALDPPPPGGKPFVQVGSDGGLLEAPVHHDLIRISPAERFDVVVDFSRYPVGTRVTLKNREEQSGPTSEVMRFEVVRREKDESTVPERLAPEAAPGIHRGLGVHLQRLPPRPRAPRPLPGSLTKRPTSRPLRRRLEGHRLRHLRRDGARGRKVLRLQGPLRLSLPQPRARGHDDDGQLRGSVSAGAGS